jgi:hypothetical protein
MSATEIKLAALAEGKDMGLFVLGGETHRLEQVPVHVSHEVQLALRDVLWARALNQLYDNVPLAFDLLEGFQHDPFSTNRFSFTEYGSIDTYLLSDDHSLSTYVLTREMLLDPAFDLIHWLHAQQSEIYHEMRLAPLYISEGGSEPSRFQDDFHRHVCTASDSDIDFDDVFEEDDSPAPWDEFADLPELQESEDAVDKMLNDFDEMPDLESVSDSDDDEPVIDHAPCTERHDDDDDSAPGGATILIEESVISSEGESSH